MLVDSHCHLDQLDLTPFDNQLEKALQAANDQGVTHFLCVSIDLENVHKVIEIANQYKNVYASVGLHPNEKSIEPSVDDLIHLAKSSDKIIAIGETGLDYYRTEGDDIVWQQQRFINHITVAKTVKKPLIIHTRQARENTIAILKQERADEICGVMHCFTEDWETAKQAIDLGFYISFSGIITFKNAQTLRDVAIKLPLDRILIETDAPYLAPEPMRGKSNYPAYVRYVAEYLAKLRNISFEEVAQATTNNFFKLFNID